MAELPLPLRSFGYVTAQVIEPVADTLADPDELPEAIGVPGKIRFDPVGMPAKVTNGDHYAALAWRTWTFTLDPGGYLVSRSGERGVWLVAGRWQVSFQLEHGNIKGFEIVVQTDHTPAAPYDLFWGVHAEPAPNVTLQAVPIPPGGDFGDVLSRAATGELVWASPVDPDGATIQAAVDAALDGRLSSGGAAHVGQGPPPDLIVGAKVGDIYIDTSTGVLYTLQTGA